MKENLREKNNKLLHKSKKRLLLQKMSNYKFMSHKCKVQRKEWGRGGGGGGGGGIEDIPF